MDSSGLPPATLTNAITNALNASILFLYFLLSLLFYKTKTDNFRTINMVIIFLLLFFEQIIATYIHYINDIHPYIWSTIAACSTILNILICYSMEMTLLGRMIIIVSTVLLNGRYLDLLWLVDHGLVDENFIYIALSSMISYSVAAYYSKGYTRAGLILIVLSNISWIIMRKLLGFYLGADPENYPELKYDNDIYHIMLIIAISLLFFSVQKKDWIYPKEITADDP